MFLRTALLGAALLMAAEVPAAAQSAAAPADKPRVMIVLDGSGSMLAPLDGKTRMAIARESLAELLRNWDSGVELGLVAYGHRRKGDCGDIETLVPPGKPDVARILEIAGALQPKGMTPLSEAVKRAAEALRYTEQRATVILISDGQETCKADPCAVGRALKQSGVDFRAHVIGFTVTRAEEAGLRCLAEVTGGRYFAARDAKGLRAALDAAGRAAQRPDDKQSGDGSAGPPRPSAPPAPATAPDPPATVAAPAKLPAGRPFEVRWTGGNREGDQVRIAVPNAAPSDSFDSAFTSDGNPAALTAPERGGTYEVRYVSARGVVLARQTVTIDPLSATLEAPVTGAAGGNVNVGWTGPTLTDDFVTLVEPGAPDSAYNAYVYARDGSPAQFRLPEVPGRYEFRYVTGRQNIVLARTMIEVTGVTATLDAPAEAPGGSFVDVNFTGPANPGDFITIVKPDQPDSAYAEYKNASDGNPARLPLRLAPGEYEIRYVTGQASRVLARRKIVATPAAGVVLDAPTNAPIGTNISIVWTGPNNDSDYVTIVKAGAADGDYLDYKYTRDGSPLMLRVPAEPGAYEIRYNNERDAKVLARRPLTVVDAVATLEAPTRAKAGSEIEIKWTGPAGPSDFVTIVAPGAEAKDYTAYFYIRDGGPGRLKVPDAPGRYEIRYVVEDGPRIIGRRPIIVE